MWGGSASVLNSETSAVSLGVTCTVNLTAMASAFSGLQLTFIVVFLEVKLEFIKKKFNTDLSVGVQRENCFIKVFLFFLFVL